MSVDQIISQLEKAGPYSNGSRALDKEIALIFGWVYRSDVGEWYPAEIVEKAKKQKRKLTSFPFGSEFELPRFTSSLPDTMKLFRKGPCPVIAWDRQEWSIRIWKGENLVEFTCHHLPSGLCSAALKVKAQGRVI